MSELQPQDAIDFVDNDIQVLGNFPLSPRIRTLLLARNRVSSIQPTLANSIPNLTNLQLESNNLRELADLDPLGSFPALTHLVLRDNPVTKKEVSGRKDPTLALYGRGDAGKKKTSQLTRGTIFCRTTGIGPFGDVGRYGSWTTQRSRTRSGSGRRSCSARPRTRRSWHRSSWGSSRRRSTSPRRPSVATVVPLPLAVVSRLGWRGSSSRRRRRSGCRT